MQQDDTRGLVIWTGTDQQLVRAYYGDGATLVVPDVTRPR